MGFLGGFTSRITNRAIAVCSCSLSERWRALANVLASSRQKLYFHGFGSPVLASLRLASSAGPDLVC
ncbi:hypothetical protein A2U01_0065277 [Trifolium medium]|uniref:Uncharacterized protein n=1 Tax=Trifolium medium TaxID=97028 RepID=A0A392S5D6_9FABA|nr:hypothetical protein [Trifolium medium]